MASVPAAWRDRHRSSLLIQIALGLCKLARGPLSWLGVDVAQLRTILAHRLALDLNPRFANPGSDASLGLVLTCLALWFAGLAPGVLAVATKRPDLWMGVGQGMTLMLCLMFLFTQYAVLIVDATDVRVIGPLPVSDRTLFASRFCHALFYVGILCACSTFFPAVLGALVFPPWWALSIYPLATFLTGFTALAFISGLYALLLRVVGPARYQRFGVWVQVVGTSGMVALMQIGPRLVVSLGASKSFEQLAWLRWFAPPLHQLGLYELCAAGPTRERVVLALLAFAVPVAGLAASLWLASRHFVSALTAREVDRPTRKDAWRAEPFSRIGALLARARAERGGFDFALHLSRREKMFLRVTVPQIVMFGAMSVGSLRAQALSGTFLGRLFEHLSLTLTALFGPIAAVSTMSENYDARWILSASPVEDWRKVGVAAVRALFTGWIVPSMLVLFALAFALTRGAHTASLIVAFELALVISLVTVARLRLPYPFCTPPRMQTGNMRDVPSLFASVMATFPAAALATAASYRPWVAIVCACALAPVCVVAWRRLERQRFLSLPA